MREGGDSNDLLTLNTAEEMSSFIYKEFSKYMRKLNYLFNAHLQGIC